MVRMNRNTFVVSMIREEYLYGVSIVMMIYGCDR